MKSLTKSIPLHANSPKAQFSKATNFKKELFHLMHKREELVADCYFKIRILHINTGNSINEMQISVPHSEFCIFRTEIQVKKSIKHAQSAQYGLVSLPFPDVPCDAAWI